MRSMLVLTTLALVVLLGVQYFKPKQTTPPPNPQSQAQTQSAAPQPAAQGQQAQQQLAAGTPQAPTDVPTVVASVATDTTIENDKYKIVFTNKGAQVKQWILKGYNDTAGKPLDMVQPQAAAVFGLPLSFFTYEPALTTQLNQALYQVTASGAQPSATGHAQAPATDALTFRYAANGLDVVKTVRFDNTFVITVETEVKRNGQPIRALVQWPAGLGDMEEFLPSSQTRNPVRTPSQFAWSLYGKPDSVASAKVSGNATLDQP
jgi:YidC/Oxa1 family membrane protein insertase